MTNTPHDTPTITWVTMVIILIIVTYSKTWTLAYAILDIIHTLLTM